MKFCSVLIFMVALGSVCGRAETISGHVDAGFISNSSNSDAPIYFSDGTFHTTTQGDPSGFFASAFDQVEPGFVHAFATANIPANALTASQYAHAGVIISVSDTITDTNPALAPGTPDPTFALVVSAFGSHDAVTAAEPYFEEDESASLYVSPGVGPAGCTGSININSASPTAVCALPNAFIGETFTFFADFDVAVYVQGSTPFTAGTVSYFGGTVDIRHTFDIYGGSAAGSYLVSTDDGTVYATSAADATPEPAGWMLAAGGLGALVLLRRRYSIL